MSRTMFDLDGMFTHTCVEHVTETLSIQGVSHVDVHFNEGTVEIEHAPTVSIGRLIMALELVGYEVRLRGHS